MVAIGSSFCHFRIIGFPLFIVVHAEPLIFFDRFEKMGSPGFSWKLADHPKLPKGKTVAVVVLDGWGEANPDKFNCIHVAETPTMDSLKEVVIFAGAGYIENKKLLLVENL